MNSYPWSNEDLPCSKCYFNHLIFCSPSSDVYQKPWRALAGWFLGPRAENREKFNDLVVKSLTWYENCRQDYYPCDPCYINEETKASTAYTSEISQTEEELKKMHNKLAESVPFFSARYKVSKMYL